MASLDASLHNFLSSYGWMTEAIVRLALAGVAGAAVGLEREVRGRIAGFRTNLLVCLGSAMVMIVSTRMPFSDSWSNHPSGISITSDPARIAYGVMTGIGFLGAGAILHDRGTVRGLTTAAALWCVTAIGLGFGFGLYTVSLAATLMVVLALWWLEYLQNLLPRANYRLIIVRTKWATNCIHQTVKRMEQAGLKVIDVNFHRSEDLQHADVELRVMYRSADRYYHLEQELARDETYTLMAIQE